MKIIGIDPGTVKLGITLIEGTVDKPIFFPSKIVASDKLPSEVRFVSIIQDTVSTIRKYYPTLVVMEYPFNIMGHAKVLIELYGAVRFHCLRMRIPFLQVDQSRIKKYATGKGNAEKSDMRMQAYKEFNLDLSEDEADSFWIAHMGMTYLYGSKTKYRQESIDAMIQKAQKKVKKIKIKKQ